MQAARQSFAQLVQASDRQVSIGTNTSTFVGLSASSLPRGSRVLLVDTDFTSLTLPFVAHADRLHPETGYYGTDVALATSARRFDTSPSGANWIGAQPALELLAACDLAAVRRHNVNVANHFRRALGLPDSDSAIVSVPAPRTALDASGRQGIRFSRQQGSQAGHARFSFHLYTTTADAERVASIVREHGR